MADVETERPTPQRLLYEAAAKIDAALELLDMSETACAHCLATRFDNRIEAGVFERLLATPRKLRESAGLLTHLKNCGPGKYDYRLKGRA